MITSFLAPSLITQVSSHNSITNRPSVDWVFESGQISENAPASTMGTLYTMSGFWQEKFYSETSQLQVTEFGFSDTNRPVVGIELELNVLRVARIQDLVIQLILDGNVIGENRASIINPVQSDTYTSEITVPLDPVDDYNIYGSDTDMWGTVLSSADVANPTFGVAISFRSNVIYPHNDVVYLHQAALRISYA